MRYLNLGYTLADAKPLTEMTWLTHLWWSAVPAKSEPLLRAALGPVIEEETEDENAEGAEGTEGTKQEEKKPMTEEELAVAQGKTILKFRTRSGVGGGWRRTEGYYAMRDALHAPYDLANWGN